jgi:hypothetical protein
MQTATDDDQKKVAPVRESRKSDGWREREESRTAGVAPRLARADGIVRC